MSTGNGATKVRPAAVARNARALAYDVLELAELQTQLLKVDTGDWTKRLTFPLVLLVTAIVIGLGCVPVLLLSLARFMTETIEMSESLSLLIAALLGLTIGLICGVLGWMRLRGSFSVFGRSREEFQRNIRWIKRVLHR